MATSFVAITATDLCRDQRYIPRMARRKTYNLPPLTPMNQWVRDAFAYALDQGRNITYNEMGDELTAASLGQPYDKTKVQKMTIARKVTLVEAEVISRVTGFPTRESQNGVAGLSIRYEAFVGEAEEFAS